ncbi:MAG: hypothetical protein AB8H79_02600, partial [Myxococcota bacterium]
MSELRELLVRVEQVLGELENEPANGNSGFTDCRELNAEPVIGVRNASRIGSIKPSLPRTLPPGST